MRAKREEYRVVHRGIGGREPQMGGGGKMASRTITAYDLRELIDFERYVAGRTSVSLFLLLQHTILAGTTSTMVTVGLNRTETADYYKCG